MGTEEQAKQCRRGLEATLQAVHERTEEPQTAADLLLHRMNAVLRAAVAKDSGAGCLEAINSLYESIDREQPGMVTRNEDLPLLLFASSFAVVLEGAMGQLQKQHTATVPHSAPPPSPKPSRKWVTPWEDEKDVKEQDKDVKKKKVKDDDKSIPNWRDFATPAAACAAAPSVVSAIQTPTEVAAHSSRNVLDVPLCVMSEDEIRSLLRPFAALGLLKEDPHREAKVIDYPAAIAARQRPHPRRPDKILDYSPEAIKGRIYFGVPWDVSALEIRALLQPFGPILEFSVKATLDGRRAAFAKLQSNEAVDAAIRALNPAKLGNGVVRVRRQKYYERNRKEEPHRDRTSCNSPSSTFGSFKEPPFIDGMSKLNGGTVRRDESTGISEESTSRRDDNPHHSPLPRFGFFHEVPAVAMTAPNRKANAVMESDEETEELRDNLNNSSFFSVR